MRPFFVPAATPENQETVYATLANLCSRDVPGPLQRIDSITFVHDGEEWTATVGELLTGTKRIKSRRRGKQTEHVQRLTDPAMVLAIFRGVPFMVYTHLNSKWANPFMVGNPKSITFFSGPDSSPVHGEKP